VLKAFVFEEFSEMVFLPKCRQLPKIETKFKKDAKKILIRKQ